MTLLVNEFSLYSPDAAVVSGLHWVFADFAAEYAAKCGMILNGTIGSKIILVNLYKQLLIT